MQGIFEKTVAQCLLLGTNHLVVFNQLKNVNAQTAILKIYELFVVRKNVETVERMYLDTNGNSVIWQLLLDSSA
jgi:hypothetical protein